MKRDMVEGSIARAMVAFTVPLMLSGILQQLFNWVDAFIVGNVEGELALAGIGATTALYSLFVMVITGFTGGLSVLAARAYGMGEQGGLSRLLSAFSLLLGSVFTAVAALGLLLTPAILRAMDTPADIFTVSERYLRIMFAGVPLLAVYNTYSAILRGMGNSRAPFLSVLVCSGVNVVLDVAFVVVLRYGAAGAAAATVLSQGAMTVFLVLYAVKKYPVLRFQPGRRSVDRSVAARGSGFGLPPAIQSGTNSVGNIFLQRFMNGFGEQTVAAITTAYRVDTVLLLPVINFGSGIATVVAQNIGAGEPERARKALKTGAVMMAGISLGLTVLILVAGEALIAMFGLTQESVTIGGSFFRTIASFYLVYSLAMALRGYLEGMGDMIFSGAAGIAALAVRIVCSYAFAGVFGRKVIAYAEAFSWLVLLGVYLLRYIWVRRRERRK